MRTIRQWMLAAILLLCSATAAWADDGYETFETNKGQALYTGTHFKIECDNGYNNEEDIVDGFWLGDFYPATISSLNGENITKVVLTVGWGELEDVNQSNSTAGYVKASDDGTTITITAINATTLTLGCGEDIQIKAVTVYWGETVVNPVTGVSLSHTSAGISIGEKVALTATLSPNDATTRGISWTTSNAAVATVDGNGIVTGTATGTATITVTTDDGGYTATCEVTVDSDVCEYFFTNQEQSTYTGEHFKIEANEVGDEDGFVLNYYKKATISSLNDENITKVVLYVGANEGFAPNTTSTVGGVNPSEDNSVIYITGINASSLTVATTSGYNSFYDEYMYVKAVKVYYGDPLVIPATGVTLSPTEATISLGESTKLTPSMLPNDATTRTVKWTSGNEKVATVDDNGTVTAVGAGTATITVTTDDGGYTAGCEVTVPTERYEDIATTQGTTDYYGKHFHIWCTYNYTGHGGSGFFVKKDVSTPYIEHLNDEIITKLVLTVGSDYYKENVPYVHASSGTATASDDNSTITITGVDDIDTYLYCSQNSVEITHIRIYYTTPLNLSDTEDNTEAINQAANLGVTHNVKISGRTLYKNGAWNTLCLPFKVSSVEGTPLEGAEMMFLSTVSYANGTLWLNFMDARYLMTDPSFGGIPANVPIIVKWTSGNNITDPAFKGVTIASNLTPMPYPSDGSTPILHFTGTYGPVVLKADDRQKLYLGADNTLYYPTADVTVGSFRAYFELRDGLVAGTLEEEGAKGISNFVLNFGDDSDVTGILPITAHPSSPATDAWFTLDGRRLAAKPKARGIYINNGKKVVIK